VICFGVGRPRRPTVLRDSALNRCDRPTQGGLVNETLAQEYRAMDKVITRKELVYLIVSGALLYSLCCAILN
jgi:hypothetical protein